MSTRITSNIKRPTGVFSRRPKQELTNDHAITLAATDFNKSPYPALYHPFLSEDEWLVDIRKFIELHIGDHRLNASWLANQRRLSRRHLQRRIKAAIGMTPHQFINGLKMERARLLLESMQAQTVGRASRSVGFIKTAHFSKLFKAHHGISPSDVIKKARLNSDKRIRKNVKVTYR